MSKTSQITIREIELKDIDFIVKYWLESDADFLVGMGVDLSKLPKRSDLTKMLTKQIKTPITQKTAYALIWEVNKTAVGHSNVSPLVYGQQATMHLHLWHSETRKKGMGTLLIKQSLPFYFERLALKTLICEPYAFNPAPNKTLEKVGFTFVKKYKTIPGPLNSEQEVNRWELTREQYDAIYT
jgi:RimJ/RimL family protein N-acetyltransferase